MFRTKIYASPYKFTEVTNRRSGLRQMMDNKSPILQTLLMSCESQAWLISDFQWMFYLHFITRLSYILPYSRYIIFK